MLFPIGDDQVKGGHFPLFSYAFIIINVLIFVYQLQFEGRLFCTFGAVPATVMEGQQLSTLFSSMFLHSDWLHLLFNMLFLWVFADNIEATVGNRRFVLFYVIGGLAAVAAHIYFSYDPAAGGLNCCFPCSAALTNPCTTDVPLCSGSLPMVGASGAISAVMGAYLVLFPSSKVKILFLIFPFRIPAFIFLGVWIFQQILSGTESLQMANVSGGVAWWAHIGGFIFGVLAGLYFRKFKPSSGASTF